MKSKAGIPSRAEGFSLIEVLVVVAVMLVFSSVGIIQLRSSLKAVDSDTAINLVSSQLRYARQVAVDQRRNVRVEFISTSEIDVTRLDGGGATTLLSKVFLPTGFAFALPMGVADTPDGYGNTVPVSFNLGRIGTFLGDGIFVSDLGIVMNGTVFTMSGSNGSARALTLTGASGRMRTYWIEGGVWTERI